MHPGKDGKENEAQINRFRQLLARVVDLLRANFGGKAQARYIAQIIFELPQIDSNVFDLLKEACTQESKFVPVHAAATNSHLTRFYPRSHTPSRRVMLCYAILKELALWRPPTRNACLDIILEFVSHPLKPLRAPALQTSTSLFLHEAFSDRILHHALDLMLLLKQVTHVSKAAPVAVGTAEATPAGNADTPVSPPPSLESRFVFKF